MPITCKYVAPAFDKLNNNWIYSQDSLKKHVGTRAAYLTLAPTSFITTTVDTVVGIGAGIGSVLTLGLCEQLDEFAFHQLHLSNNILTRPYEALLRTVNPKAAIYDGILSRTRAGKLLKQPSIKLQGKGFVTDPVFKKLSAFAKKCASSEDCLKQHVVSRLTYALLAISLLVTRAVDGILAIPAVAASFLTLGTYESVNNLAFRTLQATGIVHDLFHCTIKVINPWTTSSFTLHHH